MRITHGVAVATWLAILLVLSPVAARRVQSQQEMTLTPGLYVYDDHNQQLGLLGGFGTVVTSVDSQIVSYSVEASGIPWGTLTFYYETPDCSGTRSMKVDVPRYGVRYSNSIYYPAGESRTFSPTTERRSPYFVCESTSAGTGVYAEASSFPISHFGPPFWVRSCPPWGCGD